jgi:hypothetical protein
MEPTPSVAERIIRLVPDVGRSHTERAAPAGPAGAGESPAQGRVVEVAPPGDAKALHAVVDLTAPEHVVDLTDGSSHATSEVVALPVFASEDGCGPGDWCASCREEIRQEALTWIRDLNTTTNHWAPVIPEVRRITGDLWSQPD